jgi:hypothetical protein
MKRIVHMLPIILFISAACGGSRSNGPRGAGPMMERTSERRGAGHDEMASSCPMKVPGTTVVEADVDGGAALVFSTTGDRAELQQRSVKMATMHNQMPDDKMMNAAGPASSGHQHGPAHQMPASESHKMPPSVATAEPTDQGARLVFRPKDPAQMDALRVSVRAHAAQMEGGKCPMADWMHKGADGSSHR